MRSMTPDDLYAIRWVGACAISPDATRVAVVVTTMDRESDSYRSAIWMVPAAGGEPWQFTAGAKRDAAPKWSPDGRWLAFLSERGEDKPQLALMPASGGESRLLTELPFGAGEPVWSPDSIRIAFAARTGTPPDPDPKKAKPFRRITSLKYKLNGEGFIYDRRRHIFVLDVVSGALSQVTDGDWDDAQPAWSPDGEQLAFTSARHDERDYDTWNDLWAVPAAGGEPRRLTSETIAAAGPAWSPDGQAIAFIGRNENPGNRHLWTIPAAGGQMRRVDPALDRNLGSGSGADVTPPVWLADGSLLALAENHGENALVRVTPDTPASWLAQPPRQIDAVSVAGNSVAFVASTVTGPAELSLVDLTTGDERQLTGFNREWRELVALSAAEKFSVGVADGVDVDCWIMKPAGFSEGQQYPVLLSIHGGPFGQYGETFFDEFHVFTGAGYGVVFCNPRGGSGQDSAFAQALVGHYGEPDFHDVMTAFGEALDRMPWADRSRLGVIGGSYGGFMTSWIIGHSQRFHAAISERAVNDWYGMQGNSDIGSYFNPSQLGEHAMLHDDLQAVLRQSPLTYAKDIQTPVLILHSEDDLRCPIEQAEQLFVVLKLLRKDVEFVRFPDESHELSRSGRPSHRVDRFAVILDYFSRKLTGGSGASETPEN